MFAVLKKYRTLLSVTPDSGAEPCDFLPRSLSKRCIAASVAQTKRAAADQAVVALGACRGAGRVTGSIWAAPRIADRASGRDNNFNLLRILAALGVLVSHAYPISLGAGTPEPLSALLGDVTLGTVSVMIFFSISGFFITRSFAGRTSLARFMQARCLRLFPALIVVLIVTVLVCGLWFDQRRTGRVLGRCS